jgi:ComEC/Rec2-related protein
MRRRLTPALVLFCVLLAALLAVPGRLASFILFAAVIPAAAAVPLLLGPAPRMRRAGLLVAAVAAGLALGAGSLGRMVAAREQGTLPVDPVEVNEFTGTVRADSLLSREGDTVLRVAVREVVTRRGVVAATRSDALVLVRGDWRFAAGESVIVRAGLRAFDGTGRERYISGAERGDVHSDGFAIPLMRLRAGIREAVHRAISGVGYPASALLEALLVGAREDVPVDISDGFRLTGSLHVLSLSGLHAGIVFAAVSLLLRPLRSRGAVYLVGVLLLCGYLFVAGPMPALARAVVMLIVGGAARLADRDNEPLNLLAISGIILVAVDPFAAPTLSFQLSFLGLAGLLALGPTLARPLEGRVPRPIAAALGASAGAQLATLPVVIASFGAWYPSGILAALPLVPLITVYLWLGLAWLVVFPLVGRLLIAPAAWLFDVLYRAIAGTNGFLARVPGILFTPVAAPWWAGAAAAAVFALAILAPRGARKRLSGKGIAWVR